MRHAAMILGTALSCITLSCGGAATGGVGGVEPDEVAEEAQGSPVHPVQVKVAAEGCEGIGGTWLGQAYSAPHSGFYEFTAHITQPDPASPELEGSLVAHSWAGTSDDVVAPGACDGDFHWTVLEDAAGTFGEDGAVSFGGTAWRVGEHFCGEAVTDYSLDHLDLVPLSGDPSHVTTMAGVLTDGAAWAEAGLGIELTRIACD